MQVYEKNTFENYTRELGYKLLLDGSIDDLTLQDYIVYLCDDCKKIKKYSLQEVELHIRRSIAKQALDCRMYSNAQGLPKDLDLDSKMFYCGKCMGIDSDNPGNCLLSVAKHCSIYKGLKI